MEQELLRLLAELQSPQEVPRRNAEAQLSSLYSNDGFPIALVNIASAAPLDMTARQAGLLVMKRYVTHCWSSGFEDFKGPIVKDEIKNQLRPLLLALVTDEQRKIRAAASYVVSKIASSDFPEEWPTLLQDLLKLITEGNEFQVHGALRVLSDLLEDGFSDEQFFSVAKQLVQVVYEVAFDERRNYSVRSLSVSIFRSCIEMLEMVKEDHAGPVNEFAKQALELWVPFFAEVLEKPLPPGNDETLQGLVTLKIQVIRTVMQVRQNFTALFTQFIGQLFGATWRELNTVKDRYITDFISNESEGRLVDLDSLPYSLDLFVLEQLDFIQSCLKNKTVRDELERSSLGGAPGSPLDQMVFASIALSQVAVEDEGMWEIDLNVFLCEETSISANYTPRTASGDLILKLGEWFPAETVISLWNHTQRIFAAGENRKLKEAALFVWDQLLSEFVELGRKIDEGVALRLLDHCVLAIGSNNDDDQFLRARGYLLAGTLTKAMYDAVVTKVPELIEQTLRAAGNDPSEIVRIACIRIFQKYCDVVTQDLMHRYQPNLVAAIHQFLVHKNDDDPEDSQDVLAELVETLRSVLGINYAIAIDPNAGVIDLLFAIAGQGPLNLHLSELVNDTFEDIVEESYDSFIPLCEKLLPLITQALDPDQTGKNHPLMPLCVNILFNLGHHGSEPLPNGFVAATVPRLSRILLQSDEGEVLQSGCEALKEIVKHDVKQLIEWRDANGKSGLEVTLFIIDRLLRPEISDAAALEVGGLAAEVVDKATDHLGPFLPELLRAVAVRISTAKLPPLVQGLILVFARLVLKQAKDVVEFLAGLSIGDKNGLHVVLDAWMENAGVFSGYEEIRQNVAAMCELYRLQDPRLAQIMVQGDLIVPESNRIMTRSKAKESLEDDLQYTSIPVPVKIVKLLVQELGPGTADIGRSYASAVTAADDEASEDGEWEDVPAGLNVPGLSREELLALGGSGRQSRQTDDETYAYLVNFFREVGANNIGGFQDIYLTLKPEEQHQLSLLG
ncbi:hypothetical protein RUND412_006190 [Rhizina undulata]